MSDGGAEEHPARVADVEDERRAGTADPSVAQFFPPDAGGQQTDPESEGPGSGGADGGSPSPRSGGGSDAAGDRSGPSDGQPSKPPAPASDGNGSVSTPVTPSAKSPAAGGSEGARTVRGGAQLQVRNRSSSGVDPVEVSFSDLKGAARAQDEAGKQAESDRVVESTGAHVRRLLGTERQSPDFVAESLQHVMGLTREGERVNPELEQELVAELDALGVNLDAVHLRYETLTKEDRRQLTTFQVQHAFLRVVERVDQLASQASVSLGHRIRMFDAEARDQLKLVAGLRVLLETEQTKVEELVVACRGHIKQETEALQVVVRDESKKVEELVVACRDRIQQETEALQVVVRDERKSITDKVKELDSVFSGLGDHVKSLEQRIQKVDVALNTAGSSAEAVEKQSARVMNELQRADGSGRTVWRLALLGGVIGSAVGGFFAFVVMLLLWAATSG